MRNIYSPIDIDQNELLLDDERHELFYSKINALSEEIQEMLFDPATEENLRKIAEQFGINQNQTIEMTHLVKDLLLADIYLGNIVSEVRSRLAVSEGTAREIANGIITQIFAPALEELKRVHIEKFGKKNPAAEETPAALPDTNPNNMVNLRSKQNLNI